MVSNPSSDEPSLRDKLAMLALPLVKPDYDGEHDWDRQAATAAYRLADAMLESRGSGVYYKEDIVKAVEDAIDTIVSDINEEIDRQKVARFTRDPYEVNTSLIRVFSRAVEKVRSGLKDYGGHGNQQE